MYRGEVCQGSWLHAFRHARFVLKTIAVVVTVSFLGLYLEPVAMAARLPDRPPAPARAPSNEEKLAEKLEKLESRLEKHQTRLERRTARRAAVPTAAEDAELRVEQDELKTERQELDILDKQAIEDFEKIEKHLKDKQLPQVILDRHTETVKQYKTEMATLKANLDGLEQAKSDEERGAHTKKAKEHLRAKKKKRVSAPIDPNNLPTRALKPNRENKPKLRKEEFHRAGLFENPTVKVAALGDFRFDRLPGASDPAFLAATPEVVLSDAIRAKAAELEYNPLKIYNWLYANTNWLPTWGAIQNSDTVLKAQKGNSADLASLLIALLRASGHPARYVHGTIEIPADRFMNWVGGFTDPISAWDFASAAGLPVAGVISGGKIVAFRMEHIWVEAAVDFYPSGATINKSADAWVSIDPSFKQYVSERGYDMHARLGFDGEQFMMDYIANGADRTPYQHYSRKVLDYLKANQPDWTLVGLYGHERVSPLKPTVGNDLKELAASLPYRILARGYAAATIPEPLRNKVTIEIANRPELEFDASYTVALPELGTQRLTLSYIPASAADDAVVNDYGSLFSSPAYLVSVKPVLRKNGVTVAIGAATTLGEKQTLRITFQLPTLMSSPIDNQINAGSYSAIVFQGMDSARNIPASVMQQLMRNAELNEQGLAKIDDLLGQLLHNIGTLWFFDLRHERDFYASTTQVSYTTLPSEVIATSDVTVSFFLGIPRRVREGSMTVDADRDTVAVAPFSGDSTRRKNFMVLAGMTGSAWEHLVFENFFDLEGASSMKLLRLANDQRVPIHVIDQRNIAQVLPLLRLSAEDVADIVNGVNSGGKAIVSETEIQLDKYRGVGLVIIDQISGGGLYLISGGLSGGSACGIPADPDKECAVNEWKEKVASRASVANAARSAIVRWAISMVGTPYSMGCRDPRYPPTYWCKQENDDGSPKDPNGIDCSGLAAYAYSRVGYPLKGSNGEDLNAAGQYAIVPNHPAPPSARQADLIFWEDTYKPGISHVGILWHKVSGQPIGWIAAQDQMVGIYFDKEYWNERFVGYGSVFNY